MPQQPMRRAARIGHVFFLTCLAAVCQPSLALEGEAAFTTRALGGPLYMLQGKGGNIGVSAGADGVFIIDDDFAEMGPALEAALAAISEQPVRFVVNTHWHLDHAGNNERLGRAGSVIIAHENVRRRLSTDQVIQAFGREVPALEPEGWPIISFTRELSMHLNGERAQVLHIPHAHTDGDAVIVFHGSNVVHTGDLFFHGRYPFIDVGSGGSIDGMIAGAERVLALTDAKTRIIPGHGPLATRAELRAYIDDLKTMRARVQAEIDAGGDRAAVVAAAPLAELDARLGGGFLSGEVMAGIIYDSLTR